MPTRESKAPRTPVAINFGAQHGEEFRQALNLIQTHQFLAMLFEKEFGFGESVEINAVLQIR